MNAAATATHLVRTKITLLQHKVKVHDAARGGAGRIGWVGELPDLQESPGRTLADKMVVALASGATCGRCTVWCTGLGCGEQVPVYNRVDQRVRNGNLFRNCTASENS